MNDLKIQELVATARKLAKGRIALNEAMLLFENAIEMLEIAVPPYPIMVSIPLEGSPVIGFIYWKRGIIIHIDDPNTELPFGKASSHLRVEAAVAAPTLLVRMVEQAQLMYGPAEEAERRLRSIAKFIQETCSGHPSDAG